MTTKQKWQNGIVLFLILLAIGVGVFAFFLGQTPPPIEKTATVELQIKPSPDFSLAVNPSPIITYPNRTIAYNITLTPINSFAGQVTVSVTGLPTGVTATFLPADTATIGGPNPSGIQMNIAIPDNQALVGTYTLTIKARSENYN